MRSQWVGLVGDVGGTNARLALVDGQGHIRNPRTFPCKDYSSLTDIVAEYIETTAGKKRPPRAVMAVAGPVVYGIGMALFITACVTATPLIPVLLLAVLFNALGRSVQTPAISTLVSHAAPPRHQGAAFGLFHGMGRLDTVRECTQSSSARYVQSRAEEDHEPNPAQRCAGF